MKSIIQKLLTGGIYHSAAPVAPLEQAAATSGSSSGSSSKDDGLLPKSLMDELYKKGITVDVDQFMDMLSDFENSDFGMGVNKRALYKLRSEANRIVRSSLLFDKVLKAIDSNGAWDEYAVDTRGNLFVQDEQGKILKVHMSKFDATKLAALTVGELVLQREYNPNLAGNSDIFTTLGNNIGVEKINDYILDIIKAVGSTDDTKEAYQDLASIVGKELAKRPREDLQLAIRELYNLVLQVGPDAIFKVKDLFKSKNMDAAMSYIYSMLPNNMRLLLMARNVAEGGKYENSGKYASNIITLAAMAGNDVKSVLGIDYDSSLNKAAGTSAGAKEGTPKVHNLSMLELFFNADLNNQNPVLISNPEYKNKYALSAVGTIIPSLTTDDNKAINNVPLSVALQGKGMGKYLDMSKIYMGFLLISEGMLQNIAYTSAEVANVWLPVDRYDNIDWNQFHAYSAAEEQIRLQGITDPAKKNQIHLQMGSSLRYDSNGKPILNQKMAQFFMTHGYTIDDHVSSDNTLSRELTGLEEDEIDQVLDSIYNKKFRKLTGVDLDGRNVWDDIIQVPIFIKIQPNAALNAATYAGQGSLVTNNTLEQDMLNLIPLQQQFTAMGSELYQL